MARAVLLLLLAQGSSSLGEWGQELRWRTGESLVEPGAARAERSELSERLMRAAGRHALVLYERPLGAQERAVWRAAGVEIGRALGGGAYLARIRARRLDARALERLGALADVRELELAWKLHPLLAAGETPPWTVIGYARSGEPDVALNLLLQHDVALERGQALLAALGGGVLDVLESVNGLVAFVPRSRVAELAALDDVAWVEPVPPRLEGTANDTNQVLSEASLVQAAPYNLDGSGVTVVVYDEGTARASHQDFGGRLTVRDSTFLSFHATHVAATLGGSGAASGGAYEGMAPGVLIESYGYEDDGFGLGLFSNAGDLEDDYADAIANHGADLASNSLGTNVEQNGYNCAIQGDYGVMPQVIDGVVRGSLGAPFRVVWANGNERAGGTCEIEGFPGYYSMAPPATAKNAIAVGATNANDDSMTSFSSWGPTDDGRLKPDVCAPGCQAGGDGGVTSADSTSDTAYTVLCGTSMAAPTVAGIAALVIEDWRAQFGGADPRNSTLKAMFAHTAVDRGNPGPDHQFGYGSVRAQDAIDFMRLGQGVEASLAEQGSRQRYTLTVDPGDPELKLTLAWDDYPAEPCVFGALVNDLDLVVLDPSGVQHHVWTLDPANPGAAAVQTGPDHQNNLEQVLVSSPAAGTWQVEVRGTSVPAGPQVFSLVSSHPLSAAPCVQISFPDGLPAVLTPGLATDVTVRIAAANDTLIAGSPRLYVRYHGPTVITLGLTALGGDLYKATLPPPSCRAEPEFAFSARGAASGIQYSPAEAPATLYQALAAEFTTVLADDFETDQGWTVVNDASLTDGAWARGIPAGNGARGDPLVDYDSAGTGSCWVTELGGGFSDVDGGPTRLVSPQFSLSPFEEYEVSYAYWFSNDDYDADELRVEVSIDGGGSWTTAHLVTAGGNGGGWALASFLLNDFVVPSSQVKLRFSVQDPGNDSNTEAGLDAFLLRKRDCTAVPDCNKNGILDSDDISSGRSLDTDGNGVPDECGLYDKHRPASTPTVMKQRDA